MVKKITVLNEDLDLPFKEESSLLELLLKNDIDIDHSCGGMGSCGTCRIIVQSDLETLPERNEIEQERANDLNFENNERLACQLCPQNNLKIKIPYGV
jgi:2Fe-2S ferredoxin